MEHTNIGAETWLAVERPYRFYLGLQMTFIHAAIITAYSAVMFLSRNSPTPLSNFAVYIFPVILISLLWFYAVWAKKRAQRLLYRVLENEIDVQKGFLFWHNVAVPFNRIQHTEVNQGPIERMFGLATLSIFTAGTVGSDLQLPGLTLENAHTIKDTLVASIKSEDAPNEG